VLLHLFSNLKATACAGTDICEVIQDLPACRYGVGQINAGQGRAGRGRAGQGRAEQGREGQDRAGQSRLTSASHGSHAVLRELEGQPLHQTYAENSPSSAVYTAATIRDMETLSPTFLTKMLTTPAHLYVLAGWLGM